MVPSLMSHALLLRMPLLLHRENTSHKQNSRHIHIKPTYLEEDIFILNDKGADVNGARKWSSPFGLQALLDPTGQVVGVCNRRACTHEKCPGRSLFSENISDSSKIGL